MSDNRTQVEQLTEELALIQRAIAPKEAAKALRDYMDNNAKNDALAGTAEGPNIWLQTPSSGGACCVIS